MDDKQNKKTENHTPKLDSNDRIKSKKEENIYEMPNGRYMVIVQKRINGKVKTKKKRNVKLIQEARQLKKKFIYELNDDYRKHKEGRRKWKVAYEKYLENIRQRIDEERKHAENAGTKPPGDGPYETAKAAYNYTKQWDRLYLTEISQSHIHSMINMPAFKLLGYGQKKHLMRHIRNAFKFNLGPVGGIFLNPAHGVYVPRDKNEEPHQAIWIRPEVMEKVFNQLFNDDMIPTSKISAPVYIGYYSGLRSGELYALEWKDVYLDDTNSCYFKVNATYNWKLKKKTPTKSGQDRVVDVTAIRDFLLRLKFSSTDKVNVFPRDKEWEKGKMARAFRTVIQSKEVGYEPDTNKKGKVLWPRFHDLRSSYIMNLLTAKDGGVSHIVVQQMAGHASWDTTAHYVAKITPEEIKGISKKLNPYKKSRKIG